MASRTVWKFKVGLPDPEDKQNPKAKTKVFTKRAELVGGHHTPQSARDFLLRVNFPNARWMSMPEPVTAKDLVQNENPVRKKLLAMRAKTPEGRKLRAQIPTSGSGEEVKRKDALSLESDPLYAAPDVAAAEQVEEQPKREVPIEASPEDVT